jgi:hypothetical protein
MKLLKRNLSPFHYSLYTGKTPVTDSAGYETGESEITYAEPVAMRGNISPASGQSQIEQFGNLEQYDKVIVIDDMNCPIDENTVLYVDVSPGEGVTYDYTVKKVAKSLNHIAYAISKVKVSASSTTGDTTPSETTGETTQTDTTGDTNAEEESSQGETE